MAKSDFNTNVESLISIFTVEEDKLKILLMRKNTEPYKGYWILPGSLVKNDETIEDNITNTIYDKLGLVSLYLEQSHTYSSLDRNPDDRVIAVNYIGLVDSVTLLLKREEREDIETGWFNINDLPKLGYDHANIIEKTLTILGKKLNSVYYIRNLFPADFTLPELERVLTSLLDRNVDRRNFRKRLIKLNIIEETGEKTEGNNGRPAKLYRFKDDVKDVPIF
ncbi:MAG: NUDIX hydrolase [Bacilli bacterium]|nr:NUDIX hydrolase [Bacilli bacterium]